MKGALLLSLLLVPSVAICVDSAPAEITAARARYEAAVTVATKPVRDRYLSELEDIKRRAMSSKNLALAVAADEEIRAYGGVSSSPAPAANVAAASETGSFKKRLTNTTWSWIHPNSTITFLPDGKANVANSTGYSWEVTNSGKKTVEIKFGGRTATFDFADDFMSAKAILDGNRPWDSKPVAK